MRFLILTQYFSPEIGGAQTRLSSFARELSKAGHEVEVVTAFPNYPRGKFFPGYEKGFYRKEVLDGIAIHRVWLYPAVGGGLKRMLNYGSFTLTSLYGLVRAKKPDFLFVESPPLFLSLTAFLYGFFRRVPFIFNVADLWPDVIVDGNFMKEGFIVRCLRAFEKWSYRRAAYVSTVTDSMVRTLREKKSVPAEKILFLPNGVDTDRFSPRPPDQDLQARLGLQGKKIVLWAGTLGYAHGIDNVLRAAKLLEPESDIHFLFVGDGSAKAELLQLQRDLNLNNVTFLDPVPLEQVPVFFSIAMCGLSSLIDIPVYEGARPSKFFPVFGSAKPLLFIGKGEAADLLQRAGAGIVIPAGYPQLFADAVMNLAHNPSLAQELGENGRRFVLAHLQWSVLVKNWLNHLYSGSAPMPTATTDKISVTP